jgi:hypothetical protein
MATHSPVLAATPGARIIELDGTGFELRDWDEVKTVALYRRFLADPGSSAWSKSLLVGCQRAGGLHLAGPEAGEY